MNKRITLALLIFLVCIIAGIAACEYHARQELSNIRAQKCVQDQGVYVQDECFAPEYLVDLLSGKSRVISRDAP